MGCHIYHLIGIEVKSYYGIVALGLLRFLLYAEAVAVLVELGHAIAFGVADPVAEDCGFILLLGRADGLPEHSGETCSMEDIVAQYQAGTVVTDEVLADGEGLCQTGGRGLFGILEMYTIVGAVTKEPLETGQVERGGYDEYLTDTCQHQYTDGVIHHRFVIDGHQLFADSLGDGIKACAATTGKNDSFHKGGQV